MALLDIIGPIMVGPSSSHTAGAVRIGQMTRKLLNDRPVKGEILLHGSFATTGKGHGTDKALVAGILGFSTDDMRIPNSFSLAEENGFSFQFATVNLRDAHPNAVIIRLEGESGRKIEVQSSSVGGGSIMVNKIDGIEVNFSGQYPTLIVHNQDKVGSVAKVTSVLAEKNINLATMQLYREKRASYAVMVIETDQEIPEDIIDELEGQTGILKVTYVNGL